ncbi:hypothetical protein [Nocardia rhizosphaerae]|uniref:Uncharacterized protein n=1 Tax=Nocardia rhizosphaerae TaxID=1691571 RepID=A0ABV8L4N8_9NOCA
MNSLAVTPAVAPSNPIEALLLQLGYLVCTLTNPGGCAVIQ